MVEPMMSSLLYKKYSDSFYHRYMGYCVFASFVFSHFTLFFCGRN